MLIGLVRLREVNVSAVCNLIERRGHSSWPNSIQYFCYKKEKKAEKNTFVPTESNSQDRKFFKSTAMNVFEAKK